MQDSIEVERAFFRIKDYVLKTPVVTSEMLNQHLGHEIYFKLESLQHTGAFKVRGVFNHFLSYSGEMPESVVACSTGNNGIAVPFVAKKLKMRSRVYLPLSSAPVKVEKSLHYGAEVIRTDSYRDALERARCDVEDGFTLFPSSNSQNVIAGSGTLCYEAIKQLSHLKLDAIFASCATGGLLSGCVLARNLLSRETKIFGSEPHSADDALRSIVSGQVVSLNQCSNTVADGLNVHSISPSTLPYLQSVDGFFLVDEEEILYWTKLLSGLLNIYCEPSCAINMASVLKWLEWQHVPQKILVIISGGNLNPEIRKFLCQGEELIGLNNIRKYSQAAFFDFQDQFAFNARTEI